MKEGLCVFLWAVDIGKIRTIEFCSIGKLFKLFVKINPFSNKRPYKKKGVQTMNWHKMPKFFLLFFLIGMLVLAGYYSESYKCEAAEAVSGGVVRNSMGYPGGYVVMLEISAPALVQLKESYDTEIKVINLIDNKLEKVIVTTTELPKEYKFSSSTPEAKPLKDGNLQWNLGMLEPRGSRVIRMNGAATGMADLTTCVTVTYVLPTCITVNVIQPQLTLTKTAPSEVILCDQIPLKLVVGNPGIGDATNVRINDPLPDGWATMDGRTNVTFDVGTLSSGQSREFSIQVKSTKTGTFVNKATATADGGLTAEASTTTVVRLPVLTLAKTAPETVYHGRRINYEIKVTNKGDAEARNTILEDVIPSNTTFVSASMGGEFSEKERKVVWSLGTLQPNDTRDVSLVVRGDEYGIARNTAKATAYCAEALASAQTRILGIPGTLLEVIDLEDPIQLGNNAVYEITVTNQGTDPNTGIKIVVVLEESVDYVSSSGPTEGTLTAKTLTFDPVSKLDPKKKVTWRVVVKAAQVADSRFTVTLTSNELQRPVGETESTHLYE
jgi:uncharacterized repeat protein (TIGR01451 family)